MFMHIDVDKKQFTSWQEFLSWKAIEEKNNYVYFSQLKVKYTSLTSLTMELLKISNKNVHQVLIHSIVTDAIPYTMTQTKNPFPHGSTLAVVMAEHGVTSPRGKQTRRDQHRGLKSPVQTAILLGQNDSEA